MEKVIKLESGRYGIFVNLEGNEDEELIYKNGKYYLPVEEDFTVEDNAGDWRISFTDCGTCYLEDIITGYKRIGADDLFIKPGDNGKVMYILVFYK